MNRKLWVTCCGWTLGLDLIGLTEGEDQGFLGVGVGSRLTETVPLGHGILDGNCPWKTLPLTITATHRPSVGRWCPTCVLQG
jgi:hypothetical protein